MTTKILVPVDFSTCSTAALRYAVHLARVQQAALLVVHVEQPSFAHIGSVPVDTQLRAEHDTIQSLLATEASGEQPVRYEFRTLHGDAVTRIVDLVADENVGLIVMGTTGKTGLKRLWVGSVTDAVTRRVHCPVLTLKHAEDFNSAPQKAPQLVNPTAAPDSTGTSFHHAVAEHPEETTPSLALLWRAVSARATDVHIDPTSTAADIFFRIDGRMERYCQLERDLCHALLTQFKVMADLSIADPFHAKEGRLKLPDSMHDFEVRITTVPVACGEAAALRILSRPRLMRPLNMLGLTGTSLEQVEQMLRLGEGLVMITGPTGSGKTTTLYSMLHALDDGQRKIVTLEDPVECSISRFRQLQVDTKHGVTMASGLRTLLRMDPDVLLVSEIRDPETAEIAMRAASSGKYVFTTFHSRDVASCITGIRDLHIDNRSLAGNLAGIISQRLVRRLCQECCRSAGLTDRHREVFAAAGVEPPALLRHPVGCPRCRMTGYLERVGVFEVVVPTPEIIEAIEQGLSEAEFRRRIRAAGTPSLMADALAKVTDGTTSFEEAQSMTSVVLANTMEYSGPICAAPV